MCRGKLWKTGRKRFPQKIDTISWHRKTIILYTVFIQFSFFMLPKSPETKLSQKNSAYGRQRISWPIWIWIVALITTTKNLKNSQTIIFFLLHKSNTFSTKKSSLFLDIRKTRFDHSSLVQPNPEKKNYSVRQNSFKKKIIIIAWQFDNLY